MKSLDGFPGAMDTRHVAEYFETSVQAIWHRHERHDPVLLWAELRPRGRRLLWSREKFRQWENGELRGATPTQLRRVR